MDSYFLERDFLERVLRFPFMFNQVVDTSTSSTTTESDPAGCRNAIDAEFEEIKEELSMDKDTNVIPTNTDFETTKTTKEDYAMTEELKEAMDQVTQDMIQQDEEENPNPRNPFVRKKKNRNYIGPNDIIAIRIFRDEDFDTTGKTKADLRLSDGRVKRINWNTQEFPLKHLVMGGTIIFDERPKITWGDLLK